jgi:segregation and condensation protein B
VLPENEPPEEPQLHDDEALHALTSAEKIALEPIVEAAIMAATHPLSVEQLGELFDEAKRPSYNDLARALENISMACDTRGVELVEVASGFRFQIKPAVYPYVARMWTERPSRYSRALLETLSLIAYRQPITRAEIEAVRGVAVSSQTVRTLEEREWIRVVGHREVPGRPALFGTTRAFLDYFKLKNLDELPTLSEIKDIDSLAPEFDFNDAGPTAMISAAPAVSSAADTSAEPLLDPLDAAPEASEAATEATELAPADLPAANAAEEIEPLETILTGESVLPPIPASAPDAPADSTQTPLEAAVKSEEL